MGSQEYPEPQCGLPSSTQAQALKQPTEATMLVTEVTSSTPQQVFPQGTLLAHASPEQPEGRCDHTAPLSTQVFIPADTWPV